MTAAVAFRAALGIALLTVMDAVVKGQMHHHPFIVALFMRFLMGGLCALAVLAIARPARPTRASLIGNIARVPLVVLTAGSFFYSISVLPLAEALTLSFLAPVFVALLGGERVWDEAPRGVAPPYVLFGEASARAWPEGGSPGHAHELSLVAWSVQGGDAEALAILDAMASLLDDARLQPAGHVLILLRVTAQETARPDAEGRRRATLRLEALTEPA